MTEICIMAQQRVKYQVIILQVGPRPDIFGKSIMGKYQMFHDNLWGLIG